MYGKCLWVVKCVPQSLCTLECLPTEQDSDSELLSLSQLLCLIGESFDDYSDDVCGAVVNVRTKGDKIAIWTTECENRDAVTHIG